jgi:diguanylate cyclase (GGDEF)-like protein
VEQLLKNIGRILQHKPLDSIQQFVLCQSWQGKTYSEMAKESGYGSDYIKQVGSQLWLELSEALGEKVTKKNLYIVLSKLDQEEIPQEENQPQQKFTEDIKAEKTSPDLVTVSEIKFPNGPMPLDSFLYINRPPLEELVCSEIMQPGCLMRIKAPRKTGKSSLLNRIIAHAKAQDYQAVCLDFQEADEAVFVSLDKFLRWFCINISRQLNLAPNLDDYWDAEMGSKVSCKIYFEAYLLEQIDSPIVLALNEVNLVFEHPNIAQDFLPMLRFWHEQSKQDKIWQKLRLVVVHTTEIYIPLKLNQSPFNVGVTVPLPPFSLKQVQNLAERYGLSWAASEQGAQRLTPLQAMVGGHPYLTSLALYHLRQGKMTLEKLLETASTPVGIYSQHLRELLSLLQAEPELISAMQQVVSTTRLNQLDAIAAYKLESMGLVQLDSVSAHPSCELYRLYFSQEILKQNDAHHQALLLEEQPQQAKGRYDNALGKFVNLHYFKKYLETKWQNCLIKPSLLSVILCEIDYFKFYSDSYGYQAANSSLQLISNTIYECLKYQATLIAHYDETKFAVILPQIDAWGAVGIAENIRERIKELAIAHIDPSPEVSSQLQRIFDYVDAKTKMWYGARNAIAQTKSQFDGIPAYGLTVSLGIATATPNHQNTSAMLIAAAEEALFQAKRKGRNCVIINSALS